MYRICFVVLIVVFILSGCLSLLEPNIAKFSEKIVRDINDYLQKNVDVDYLVSHYVHITEPATYTDARYFGKKLIDDLTDSASNISLISFGDSGLKSFELKQPPQWVEKVYILSLMVDRTRTISCPMLLIEGKPYLLTVYASGTDIISYPLLGE